jgi:phenylpropionate dioxygenase-like ring-hydroxylating dioxygenase large terminal subunit
MVRGTRRVFKSAPAMRASASHAGPPTSRLGVDCRLALARLDAGDVFPVESPMPGYAAERWIGADVRSRLGEDTAIVERLQAGRRSPAMRGGVFSAALEDTTHNFQKTLAQRLAAAGAIGP